MLPSQPPILCNEQMAGTGPRGEATGEELSFLPKASRERPQGTGGRGRSPWQNAFRWRDRKLHRGSEVRAGSKGLSAAIMSPQHAHHSLQEATYTRARSFALFTLVPGLEGEEIA